MWNGSKEIRVGNSVWQRRGVCPIADCQHVEMLGEWSYWFCFIGAGRAYRRGIETSIYSICNLLNQVLQYIFQKKSKTISDILPKTPTMGPILSFWTYLMNSFMATSALHWLLIYRIWRSYFGSTVLSWLTLLMANSAAIYKQNKQSQS